MTKKKHFGTLTAFKSQTPQWANNTIAATLICVSVLEFILNNDTAINEEVANRILVYAHALALGITLYCRANGIKYEKIE